MVKQRNKANAEGSIHRTERSYGKGKQLLAKIQMENPLKYITFQWTNNMIK